MCRAHMGWVPHVLVCAGWQMANLLAAELAGFRGDHVECLNPFAGWGGVGGTQRLALPKQHRRSHGKCVL